MVDSRLVAGYAIISCGRLAHSKADGALLVAMSGGFFLLEDDQGNVGVRERVVLEILEIFDLAESR